MQQLIKDSPGPLSDDGLKSPTLLIRGVLKTCPFEEMLEKFSIVAPPVDTLIESSNTMIWVKYSSIKVAEETLDRLHQFYWNGKYLMVKYELGLDDNGDRIVSKYSSSKFIVRHINSSADGDNVKKNKKKKGNNEDRIPPVTYNARSLTVGVVEYPIPTGMYMARVLATVSAVLTMATAQTADTITNKCVEIDWTNSVCDCSVGDIMRPIKHSNPPREPVASPVGLHEQYAPPPLLHVLTDQRGYARTHIYVKELSEAMSMVDGLQRALNQLKLTPDVLARRGVRVFCLGDGATCLCGACISVFHAGLKAEIYSIDPILLEGTTDTPATCVVSVGTSNNDSSSDTYGSSSSSSSSSSHAGVGRGSSDLAVKDEVGNLRLPNPEAKGGRGMEWFHRVPMMSQDFIIPPPPLQIQDDTSDQQLPLEVVIACHSHAPLQEFWDRIPCYASDCVPDSSTATSSTTATMNKREDSTGGVVPTTESTETKATTSRVWSKIAVSLNCCAQYCMLPTLTPILQYEDYEVYSPKRTVRLYAQ